MVYDTAQQLKNSHSKPFGITGVVVAAAASRPSFARYSIAPETPIEWGVSSVSMWCATKVNFSLFKKYENKVDEFGAPLFHCNTIIYTLLLL